MEIGDRVIHIRDGSVGHIEDLDGDFTDVRWLTPDNEPSCCIGICWTKDLRTVGDHVVPIPRSREWKEEARAFYEMVTAAVQEFLDDD